MFPINKKLDQVLGSEIHGWLVHEDKEAEMQVRARIVWLGMEQRVLTILVRGEPVAGFHQVSELGDSGLWPASFEALPGAKVEDAAGLLEGLKLIKAIEPRELLSHNPITQEEFRETLAGYAVLDRAFNRLLVSDDALEISVVAPISWRGSVMPESTWVPAIGAGSVSSVNDVEAEPDWVATVLYWTGRYRVFEKLGQTVVNTL